MLANPAEHAAGQDAAKAAKTATREAAGRAEAIMRTVSHAKWDEATAVGVSERLRELCELPLFHAVGVEALLRLAETSDTLAFDSGETIVRQGEPGDSVYIIIHGRVDVLARVERDGVVTESGVAALADGDALGELSLVDGRPRSATCVAVRPTRCMRLRRETLWEAMRHDWALTEMLLATLASRLRQADASLAEHARDPLTGIYNRRALFELYDRESRRAQRTARRAVGATHAQITAASRGGGVRRKRLLGTAAETPTHASLPPLALLFIDVDKFKTINDTYGHQTGDDVLVAVAHTLTTCARHTDHVARFGGDEFVVILPESGASGAEQVADRIRRTLAEDPPGPVPFSISIGAAVVDALEPPTLEELMAAADAEMYKDKERRRWAGTLDE